MNKVYFYTGSFIHPFYKEQFKFCPSSFLYISSSRELVTESVKKDILTYGFLSDKLKRFSKNIIAKTIANIGIVKTYKIDIRECNLIHSAQRLLRSNVPWVVDFEDATVFTFFCGRAYKLPWVKNTVRRILASDNCKKILPWTKAARNSLLNVLGNSDLDKKIEVVYPAITSKRIIDKSKRKNERVRILFVGASFYEKGGLETLEAFKNATKYYDVELVMVSFVPVKIKKKYEYVKNIRFYQALSNSELRNYYETSDIFVLPVHADTFGYVFLEAMSYSLPCISTKQFAVPEIITGNKTGILIDAETSYFGEDFLPKYNRPRFNNYSLLRRIKTPSKKYVESLSNAILKLIGDREMRLKMGIEGYREVSEGKFSAEKRKEKLLKIYSESVNT